MQSRQGPHWQWLLAVVAVAGPGGEALGQRAEPWASLKGHSKAVNSLAFSPDGRVLASSGVDSIVRLWEVASGAVRATLEHPAGVNAVAFAPDGKLLASGDPEGTVRLWDAACRIRLRGCLKRPGELVCFLCFSPNGRTLAVGGHTEELAGRLRLWNVWSGRERLALWGHTGLVTPAAFSADGRVVAGGDFGGVITLWEAASGKVRASLRGHDGAVWSVVFVPDSDLLASGGSDGTVRLWDMRVRKQRAALVGHDGRILCLAAAGKLLASGGEDRTLRLWDTAAGRQRLVLKLGEEIWSVAFIPDGSLLAVGDKDGTIRLWSVAKLLAQKGKK